MKRTASALLIVAGVTVAAWWHPWLAAQTPQSPANVSTVTAAQAGYRLTVDPNTGEFLDEPAPLPVKDLSASLQNALSTSTDGLAETPGPVDGVKLELQGRFHSTSVARIDGDGKLEAPCLTNKNDLDEFVTDVKAQTSSAKE